MSDTFATDTLKALEKAYPDEAAAQSLAETRKVEIKDQTIPVGHIIEEQTPMFQWQAGKMRYKRWDGTKYVSATKSEYETYVNTKGFIGPPNPQGIVQKTADLYRGGKLPAGGGKLPAGGAGGGVEPLPVNRPPEKLKLAANKWEGTKSDLRYPLEHMNSTQDYIQFAVIEYKRRALTGSGVADGPRSGVEGESASAGNQTLLANRLGTVTLPVPSQIGDNNGADYGGSNLNFLQERGLNIAKQGIDGQPGNALNELRGLFGDILKGQENNELVSNFFAGKAVSAFGGNISLDTILNRSGGVIINPNMELLFSGPKLRSFTFAFKFTPRFSKEAEEVKQIIRTFKKHSSPRLGGGFLKSPNIFQIRYLGEGGQNHQFLNRFKLCALTNMTVNYTGDGVYATYDDGTPVSTIMTLTFNELSPVYNEDYEENVGGVGY